MRTSERVRFNEPTEDKTVMWIVDHSAWFARQWRITSSNERLERLSADCAAYGLDELSQRSLESQWYEREAAADEPSCEMECLVCRGDWVVGYIDLLMLIPFYFVEIDTIRKPFVAMGVAPVYFEVKPAGFSLGAALRQIKTYRLHLGKCEFVLASHSVPGPQRERLLIEGIGTWDLASGVLIFDGPRG